MPSKREPEKHDSRAHLAARCLNHSQENSGIDLMSQNMEDVDLFFLLLIRHDDYLSTHVRKSFLHLFIFCKPSRLSV